ncbi:SMI1/KNR4 family protein [Papillibacter cinnamivorans]|uniref:SMI1 / KNR4 family (SUKH-1) n=1 Tax=Papillibacter cinnamivorans DSM 12816 TaxID=1122930 RepID=A0A1W2CTI6_9FIRM|nr:SMI1/KNR4 family protein [Papillibacter cinnamivorans]SMC88244.1 SMI1 / KNR4 family (SUKH-1) [Papillibacter cinnamivorans DSM 12816]
MAIQGFGAANPNDIRIFEAHNGIYLPNDYVKFLLTYNGGVVKPTDENSIYIEDLNATVNVDVFFGVKTKDPELDVQLWLNDYKSDMPQGTIIVGDSHQHGFIVLLCTGEETGVYYWDHAYEFPNSNDESNTYYIADTFTEVVKNLL